MTLRQEYIDASRHVCQPGAIILSFLLIASNCGCSSKTTDPTAPPRRAAPAEPQSSPKTTDHSVPKRAEKKSQRKPTGRLPRFMDQARASGIDFERYDDFQGQHRLIEANGGGVGLFDYDNDGWIDVLLTNGCALPYRPEDTSHRSELYRNLGGNRFAAVTTPSFFRCFNYAHGVAAGDFNSDGFEDFYVAAYGDNSLWQNNGDGTFTEVASAANAQDTRWSSSAAFADFNLDGLLDLYVVNYVDPGNPPKLCYDKQAPDGYRQCAPSLFDAVDDLLLLNDGSGGFTDVTQAAGITAPDGKGLSLVIFHANDDRLPDIYVANDGTPSFLYINETTVDPEHAAAAQIRFSEQASELGVAVNREGKATSCMGIGCGDYDGDGHTDLFVTNFFAETNTMYRNLGQDGFLDVTNRTRLGPPSRSLLGFGTSFLDFDNNGWLDLVVANGHIDDFSWANAEERYAMPPQFFRNEGNGTFQDVSLWSGEYFQKNWLGRGLAVGDLDNDGDQDFVVSHQRTASPVLINETEAIPSSVLIRLVGTEANRSAIGARLEAIWPDRKLARQVVGGGSYQAAPDRRVHFGLDQQDSISVLKIHWPSGREDQWEKVTAGRYVAVEGQPLFEEKQRAAENP